jgi:carboxymethylenebutenolidase
MHTLTRREMLACASAAPIIAVNAVPICPAAAATQLEDVSITTPSGRTISAVMGVPATVPAPAVVLIHAYLGLTNTFKSFAVEFAQDGFLALALDLYDGRVASDDASAAALRNEVNLNPDKAAETIAAWIEWLKADPQTNGKVGVVGWSFGAAWALEASIATPVEATVVYVGLIYPGATRLAGLKGPVLVHLAERDEFGQGHLKMFESMMTKAGKSLETHWYAGDHYFPFRSRPSYDKELAAAWTRTVEFLRVNLN